MSTSNRFKVDDTVVRTTCSHGRAVRGEHYVVSAIDGWSLDLEGHERVFEGVYNYSAEYFELIHTPQAVSEQPAVLTPLEVFQCILEGTPLEYSIKKLSGERTWHTVTNPKHIDLEDIECAEYRKKAQTVLINGISVPAPAVVYSPSIMFYINLRRLSVQHIPTRCIKADSRGLYWSTKEAAREALDAIMTSFSK